MNQISHPNFVSSYLDVATLVPSDENNDPTIGHRHHKDTKLAAASLQASTVWRLLATVLKRPPETGKGGEEADQSIKCPCASKVFARQAVVAGDAEPTVPDTKGVLLTGRSIHQAAAGSPWDLKLKPLNPLKDCGNWRRCKLASSGLQARAAACGLEPPQWPGAA